jgi:hypothetical protein
MIAFAKAAGNLLDLSARLGAGDSAMISHIESTAGSESDAARTSR